MENDNKQAPANEPQPAAKKTPNPAVPGQANINNGTAPAPSPPAAAKKTAQFSYKHALGLVLLVVIIGAIIALVWPAKKASSPQGASTWTEYTSQQYGLKFNYPKAWGTVSLGKLPASAVSDSISYIVQFTPKKPDPSRLYGHSIFFEPANAVHKRCTPDGQCQAVGGVSKKTIDEQLLLGTGSFLTHGTDYYSTLVTYPYPARGNMNLLTIYQTVNLPKINVSAIKGSVNITSKAVKCSQTQLAPNTSQDCITQADYNNLSQVLTSFTAI